MDTYRTLGGGSVDGYFGKNPDWSKIKVKTGRTIWSSYDDNTLQAWLVEDTNSGGVELAGGNYANPIQIAGNGLPRIAGYFVDGFVFENPNQVGIDASGNSWQYVGTSPLPYTVVAGTVPSNPNYELVFTNDHNSLTNRNSVGAHDDIYIRTVTSAQAIAEDAPVGTRYRFSDLLDARYDVVNASDTGGWYIAVNASKKLKYVPTMLVFAEHLGCKIDGSEDCSTAVNFAIDNYGVCEFADGEFLFTGDINVKTNSSLSGRPGRVKFIIGSENVSLLNMFECLYTVVRDINIEFSANNSTAIKIHNDTGSSSQLNKFYNVNVEGANRVGTTSVLIESVSFSNQFYSCNFFRTEVGVVFGEIGVTDNAVNANHFFGCELRAINTTSGARPVIHRGGDNNGFVGGIIENWNLPIDMQGGNFFLDKVYLEAFNSAHCVELNGGSLSMTGCFRVPFVFIYGGESFNFTGNQLLDSSNLTSDTYPLIQNRADHNCKIIVRDNQQEDTLYLYRKNQWRDGAATWQDKTRKDDTFEYEKTNIKHLLSSTIANVTGDGTQFIVPFDLPVNSSGSGSVTGGIYTAEYNETLHVDFSCYIEGSAASGCNLVQLEVVSGSEVISIYTGGIESETPSGRRLYRGSSKCNLKVGQTLFFRVTVSGGAKTVSVVGNPTSEITYMTITEVA